MMTVSFEDLTPTHLGYDEWRRRLHLLREIARFHAPGECDLRVTYDEVTRERSGYQMIVPDDIVAAWVCADYSRVVRDAPMSWVMS